MFVIVAGQLGTIINIIRRWVFGDWDFFPALGPELFVGMVEMVGADGLEGE